MKTKKNIWLWASYDFANSTVSIVFFLYFSQWIVIEQGVSDLAFNLTYTWATILLLFTVPITAFLLDTKFRRISGLRIATLASVLAYGLCAVLGILGYPYWSLGLFSAGMYFYLLTFTFYTPLIYDISHEAERGKISGLGVCSNYIGQFVGLLFALIFAKGYISFFGASVRLETLLPTTILYALLTLPMLIWFKEPKKEIPGISLATNTGADTGAGINAVEVASQKKERAEKFRQHWRSMWKKTKELFGYKSVAFFFLAYFFFNDTVLTAANNFPIFVEQVWKVSDTVKSAILAGIVITSAIGGLIGGRIADRFGYKKTLMIILYGWLVILPTIGFVQSFTLFMIGTTCMGFWFGASWAVSRAVMSYLTPPGMHNLAFGYFGLIERTSSLLGPIAWGLVVSGLIEVGPSRYRVAVYVITGFIVFGIMALQRVRSDRVQ